ncbi:MAG: serpin family protein [Clostridiales bacterium]|nr:serpin family protein [Clostridiales bacterium]
MKRALSSVLALSVGMSMFAGCAAQDTKETLPQVDMGIADVRLEKEIRDISTEEESDYRSSYLKFSFDLLNRCLAQDGQDANVMVSPASVMLALDMTAAGAAGDTLTQITGLYMSDGADPQGQISYASQLMRRLNSSGGVSLHAADSMWVNENVIPEGLSPEFVSFVHDSFDAGSESLAFDGSALDRINGWVDDNTDGMIPTILDRLDPDIAMILINAIAFDGAWADQYEDSQIAEGEFTSSSGQIQTVQMMSRDEDIYLENDLATGFVKYYEGGEYAFVVMLPKDEDQSAGEMLSLFDGGMFEEYLASASSDYIVHTELPEFSYDWGRSIKEQLISLGMEVPFTSSADLSGIADLGAENLYIGDVVHKTHIEVNRSGTRAAAATAVITYRNAVIIQAEETREVICDRPFAYAIVDMTNNTPVFIGTVNQVET